MMEYIYIFIGIMMCFIVILILGRVVYRLCMMKRLYGNFYLSRVPMDEELTYEYLKKMKTRDIDETVVNDLELKKIFPIVNRTYSEVGREYVYAQMLTLKHRYDDLENKIKKLQDDQTLKKCLYEVYKLSRSYSQSLDFFDHQKVLNRFDTILVFGSTIILIGLIMSCFWNVDMVPTLIFYLCLVAGLYSLYVKRTDDMMSQSMSYCFVVECIKKLEKMKLYSDKDSQEIRRMVHQSQRYMFVYKIVKTIQKIDVFYLMEFVNGIFFIPIYQCYFLQKNKKKLEKHFIKMYEYIGEVELALCVMSLRHDYETCIPTISDEPILSFQNAYHPLIKNPVKNSFVSQESCFITGSNASGKSTFLKTVGVNMIMAKAFHTCFAESFVYYPFQLCSSIHMRDDLESGESYYVKEIQTMKSILNMAQEKVCLIFIDEILRGTNEKERIAISKVILKTLFQSQSFILVTTHDLSLVDYFEDIAKYCFNDSIVDNVLHCDYKIRQGTCEVGNAIKLLQVYDYDQKIIDQLKKPI